MIYKFEEICLEKGFIRGPFGSALKKDLFIEKNVDTYKRQQQKDNHYPTTFYGQIQQVHFIYFAFHKWSYHLALG